MSPVPKLIKPVLVFIRVNWLQLVCYIGIALILCGRMIYASPDDENYILGFSDDGSGLSRITDAWTFMIEEPLWSIYTSLIGGAFGPEIALRITLFASVFMFLVASARLSRGAWFFVLLVFIFNVSLATLYYFIQIRIGFAIALFLVMIVLGLNPIVAAITAAFIHASFIVVVPCTILAYLTTRSVVIWYAVAASLVVFLLLIAGGVSIDLSDIDMGRRSGLWEFKTTNNINFYAWAFLQFGISIPVFRQSSKDKWLNYWLHFTVIFFLVAVGLTAMHEAATRFVAMSGVFVMILLGANMKTLTGKLCSTASLLLLLAFLGNEYIKGEFGLDSWFTRWLLILS